VNPDIVNDINEGTVSEWVDVTEHDTDAAVEAIVHVCAALAWAETTANPATTANLRNMIELRGFGFRFIAKPDLTSVDMPPPSDSSTQHRPSSPRDIATSRVDLEMWAQVPNPWCRYSK
jgi:prephenate dehydrogenase